MLVMLWAQKGHEPCSISFVSTVKSKYINKLLMQEARLKRYFYSKSRTSRVTLTNGNRLETVSPSTFLPRKSVTHPETVIVLLGSWTRKSEI